ncbi:MAG: hypothetical protein ACYC10_22390 [Allorhizobium sp.]
MFEIAGEFADIAFVGFGEAGHALASSWIRPAQGTTRAYDLKLRSVTIKKLGARTTQCLLAARRAAEVAEVCVTRRDFGLPDRMNRGTVEWQRALASLDVDPDDDDDDDDLVKRAAAVLARL